MELKSIVAKNLVDLRKNAGFTQIEIAEKLNYSDKAVSKWERGESLPDVETIKKLADLYSVSVDAILREQKDITKRIHKYALTPSQRMLIILISVGLVWAVATTVFSVLCWVDVDNLIASYSFILALPVTFIVIIVFNSLWGKVWINLLASSALLWTTALCVYLLISLSYRWLCFIVPIPLQVVLIFFYGLKILNLEIRKKRKEEQI
ncbi:MAG: helix-turn-helix transcriptional regulator [Clostridiales bacterium]|nr:helix-turn-helix transcriptional regulator [Clostridiales bacterium]